MTNNPTMTALRYLATALIGFALIYASFAFVQWNWSPSAWSSEIRVFFVIIAWTIPAALCLHILESKP